MTPQEIEAAYQEVLSDRRALLAALEISETATERLIRVVEDATVLRLVATTERLLRDFIAAQGEKSPAESNLPTLGEVHWAKWRSVFVVKD